MRTLTTQQRLIPKTAAFHVGHCNKRLRTHIGPIYLPCEVGSTIIIAEKAGISPAT